MSNYYVIQIDKLQSGIAPYGQKDCFPISAINFANGGIVATGDTKNGAATRTVTTYFDTYNESSTNDCGMDANTAIKLKNWLRDQTSGKQEPGKFSFMQVMPTDNPSEYYVTTKVEHDEALVYFSSDSRYDYKVVCNSSIRSDSEALGQEPTKRMVIDHVNNTINPK
jgi:hypothetical protein